MKVEPLVSTSDCVVLPCCGQVGTCYECIGQWLSENSSCPHCRSSINISSCTRLPQLIPIFSMVQRYDDAVIEL